jgi:hypothetical protein
MEETKNTTIQNEGSVENFDTIINRYYENNSNCNMLKKVIKEDSDKIKAYLLDKGDNKEDRTYVTDSGIVASITEATKSEMDSDKAVEFLEPLNIPGLIEIKKVINEEVLEDALYHNMINPEDLAPYIHNTISYRLNVKQGKNKK